MKKQSHYLKKFLFALFLITALSGIAQQQFIHTATKSNNYCNGNCTTLDVPELNNNPAAIIWVTPKPEDGRNINTHPIGAYYFESRWRIFNIDQAPMPAGAKFNVEYIINADQDHFKYIVTDDLLQKDGSALIDNPALNNNPNAQFNYFLSWNPAEQRGTNNRNEVKIDYNAEAGKWYISNINKKALYRGDAYNIIITSEGDSLTNIKSTDSQKSVMINELNITPNNKLTVNTNSTSGAVTEMYMTVWVNGTLIPADNPRTAYRDKTQILGFEMGASAPTSSGMLPGKRGYEPITIKSRTGFPAAVQLFGAFVKNQNIVVTIEAYTTSADGKVDLNYSIKLTKAYVAGFKQIYEEQGLNTGGTGIKKHYDEIKIMFGKIEYIKGSLIVEDNL